LEKHDWGTERFGRKGMVKFYIKHKHFRFSKSFQRFLMLIFKAYVYNLLSYEQNVAGLT